MYRHRSRIALPLLACLAGCCLVGCGSSRPSSSTQQADLDFAPKVSDPLYTEGGGPLVLIDAAHNNFHTAEGRYATFAKLLREDGYRVGVNREPFSADSLAEARILVISNALHASNRLEWTLPTPSAFAGAEIEALRRWVEDGGSLLLIADHMPFPGAAEELGRAFGLLFHSGHAYDPDGSSTVRYTPEAGLLRHPITSGRDERERIGQVLAFGGQAFRLSAAVADRAAPLLELPAGSTLRLPRRASTFDEQTPTIPADGLLQGVVIEVGAGRLAAFGEAAMFSAQVLQRTDGSVVRMGMNAPEARENPQFALNVLHWLSGELGR